MRPAVAALLTCIVVAQVPVDPLPRDPKFVLAPAPPGMVDAATAASKEGKAAESSKILFDALAFDTSRRDLWIKFAAACASDPEARWSALRFAVPALMDDKGGLPEDLKSLVGKLEPTAAALGPKRAEAAAALAAVLREKSAALADPAVRPLIARLCARLADPLLVGAPALRAKYGKSITDATVFTPEWKPILQALKEEMDRALADGKPHLAARFARNLLGFAAQAGFKDLKGPPPPNLTAVGMAARAGLARARASMAGPKQVALTVEALESMTPAERAAYTAAHNDWSDPGIAVSPNGLYRIETTCGHETLLGIAKTVEQHHARLVAWYGKDPFVGRPGLIRVVPRSSGLEAEGVPYWWAAGFQSGDVTTVKFSVGTIEGIGHTLTHELTHRFDGALLPGIPSWAVEGRASWTGGAYGFAAQLEFVDGHMSFGTVERAFIKGYGGEENFTKLLKGTIDDYRDNYTAGYALWVYLKYWNESDGAPPLFADRLPAWFETCAKGQGANPVAFAAAFCDGKKGRPKDLKEFSKKFGTFLQGFYWQNRAPWTARFEKKVPGPDLQELVLDGPTWNDDRDRSEPQFGQDHAREAGLLLSEAGRTKEALLALTWALIADEFPRDAAETWIAVGKKAGKVEGAWLVEAELAARRGDAATPPPSELKRALAPIAAWADSLQSAAKTAADLDAHRALLSDASRIGDRIGGVPGARRAESRPATTLPIDPPAEPLIIGGFVEDDLSGYEERRAKGLWYDTPEGDLVVGRSKPKEGTGDTDRNAAQIHAYARSRAWMAPGHHVIRFRVAALTSYVSGSIVVGSVRRDRQVRLDLTMGDFLYSIGAKEDAVKIKGIQTSLRGLREREGALPGAYPSKYVDFGEQRTFVDVEIRVDGCEVSAIVDGVYVGCYRMPDGQPVEGHVGFATGQGAWRISKPSIRDVRASVDTGRLPHPALALDDPSRAVVDRLLHRGTTGIPLFSGGTLVAWLPKYTAKNDPTAVASADEHLGWATNLATASGDAIARSAKDTPWVLAVPDVLGADALAALKKDVAASTHPPRAIVVHRHGALSWTGDDADRQPVPSMLFVDPVGGLRAIRGYTAILEGLPGDLARWAEVYAAVARAPAR